MSELPATSPPGHTLADWLEENDTTIGKISYSTKIPRATLARLIEGREPLTDDIAGRLGRIGCGTQAFWIAREKRYRANKRGLL